jgi:hypothetical protein
MSEISLNESPGTPQVRVSFLNFSNVLGVAGSGVMGANVFMMVSGHLTENTLIMMGTLNVVALVVLGLCEVAKDIFGKKKQGHY